MNSRFLKICSVFMAIVLLANMLPLNVWAEQIDTQTLVNDTPVQAEVLGEVIEKRTEYTKEFLLDNGSFVAAVYNEPVHFEEDGQWKEIDNTLVSKADGTYANTDGVWDVRFPQMLSQGNHISITKDGYTLSFGMAGELRNQGNLEVASANDSLMVSPSPLETASVEVDGTAQTFSVSNMQLATALIQEIDTTELAESAQHEELILEKNTSRLMYNNVYSTTDIQYDLQSNKVKESIILESYDSSLRGYRYTLNVGNLEPVLLSDGSIYFYNEAEDVVMSMPAPFLLDNNGEMSTDVQVSLTGSGSTYTLVYLLPQTWLASEERTWPVILDPVVQADPNALTNIKDRTVSPNGTYAIDDVYLYCGYDQSKQTQRTYIMFSNLPTISSSDVIVSAYLTMLRTSTHYGAIPVEAHKILNTWTNSTLSWSNKPDFDPTIEDYQIVDSSGYHTWNITDVVRGWYTGENTGVMFKADEASENSTTTYYSKFYSSDTGIIGRMPTLTIVYRNSNGLESYWDYTSASAGRAGTGHVNSYTGNMIWTRSDIGFGGNRMPVSISHIYDLDNADNNDFGLGYGWRTNFNQRVYLWSQEDYTYAWEDSDGTKHIFNHTGTSKTYKDEDGLELTLKTDGSGNRYYRIFDKTGNTSYFDNYGRLTFMENNQSSKSSIQITYETSNVIGSVSNRISSITDGAGRVYKFTYTNGLLSKIEYLGSGTTALSTVTYAYGDQNSNLTSITDNDGKSSTYTYLSNTHILSSAQDIDGYKLQYSYDIPDDTHQAYRVSQVASFDGETSGGSLSFAYAHNQTTFTDHNGNVEIMQFNDYGNVISIQDGQGRAQFAKYAVNGAGDTGKANQLRVSSKLQNTVVNLLQNSSFENEGLWTADSGITVNNQGSGYLGSKSLKLTRAANGTAAGVQTSFSSTANTTYTFSAYVKIGSGSAYLQMWDGSGSAKSTVLSGAHDWTRLEVTYTAATENLKLGLMTEKAGTVYMDCVQLETMPTASRYNLVQNGDFSDSANWTASENTTLSIVADNPSSVPQLNEDTWKVVGSMTAENRITQTINISGEAGDTFVMAGWGMGDSVPLPKAEDGENQRYFAIIGEFDYGENAPSSEDTEDEETEETEVRAIAQFNPDSNVWQYVAQPMVAKYAYNSITITLAYDYNANTAYFDGIQLFKETYGSSYTYDDDGNIISITDAEKQKTKYTYNDYTQDLTKEERPTGMTYEYTYDSWHNLKTSTSSDGQVVTYNYDAFGNLLSQTVSNNSVTTTTSSTYSSDGNRLVSTTDAAGNVTTYSYHADTNLLEWVQYPGDTLDNASTETREGTATYYEYDEMYRTTSVSAFAAENPSNTTDEPLLTASYTYEDDLLTEIETGSTSYLFDYGVFGLRSSIRVGNKTLATYSYTADQNKYLQSLAYGNGDSVQYSYDTYGRVTEQRYYQIVEGVNTLDATVTYQYDNDGSLASVTDSATGITTKYYYDFTGRAGATELRKNADLVFRISVEYDEYNRLTKNGWEFSGVSLFNSYVYNSNGTTQSVTISRVTSTGTTNLATLTYGYDGLYRVTGLTAGENSPANRQYTYRTANGQATTQIEKLSYPDVTLPAGVSAFDFQYEYDNRGNITSYTSPDESIEYTYDSQNQLLRADSATGTDYAYTYDDAGNILSVTKGSTTHTYTYGDSDWGDLLKAYDGVQIEYDAIGNPKNYYNGWNFTWKHGRQMATASNGTTELSFTYDADGLRTSKTFNGNAVSYYYYSGGKLIRESFGNTNLDFFYDQSGAPFMMLIDGTPFYYVTNAQGDVIRLVNANGITVASYQYDPYGNTISETGALAAVNPLRYRGYYFDYESGLYYLQSRYYDPEIGRFINADTFASTGQGFVGNNMFAYCNNSPILLRDSTGSRPVLYSEPGEDPNPDPAPIRYNVTSFSQEDYSLCWAFCQVMIESYRNGVTLTQQEATDAAIALAKSVAANPNDKNSWNRGNWPTNLGSKCNISNIEDLYYVLAKYGPVYANYSGGHTKKGKSTAHLVVVIGVDIQTNTVYINNPWHGYQGPQAFDEFITTVAYSSDDPYGMSFGGVYLAN